jgi:hypothetical protein
MDMTSDPDGDSRSDVCYDVVWPKSTRGIAPTPLAPRLDGLAGRRVAFLWDDLFRGDEIFPVLAEELNARYPDLDIIGYEHFGNTHGSDEAAVIAALPEELHRRHIDAVVSAMGC